MHDVSVGHVGHALHPDERNEEYGEVDGHALRPHRDDVRTIPASQIAFYDELRERLEGRHVDVDPEQSFPLLIHCAIPYSIIPDPEGYLAFCILSAYFNFIDPTDESNLSFEGYSIDLKGTILDPCHIVRIEEI